jgi:hypothetical protein
MAILLAILVPLKILLLLLYVSTLLNRGFP